MSGALAAFTYRAAHEDGSLATGRIDAPSELAAVELLSRRGLLPIRVVPERARRTLGGRIGAGELAIGLRVMADLLDAGLPVARAITALEATAPAGWTSAIPGLRDAVREGKSLARALEESPLRVPAEIIGILHAGERGAGLAAAVRTAAQLSQESADTRNAIRSALAYPILLAVAGTLSGGLLVGVVLPRFAVILGDMGQALPTSTRLVLGASAMLRAGLLPGAIVAALVAAAAWHYLQTDAGRERWHRALLDLPFVGDTRLAAATGRLCTTLAALLDAGVPIAGALPHAARASGDAAVARRSHEARRLVMEGERLSRALAETLTVSPLAARLAHAGEESGRLASLLAHAGRLERERATRRVQSLVRVIEPGLIVLFGGLVALIAASLLQALYSVRPAG